MKKLTHFLLLLAMAGAAHSKDTGIAYVSTEKGNAITLVDVKTLAVVGSIATCKRPRHMMLMPSGAQLMVACGDSNQADLIDLATRKSVGRIPFFFAI